MLNSPRTQDLAAPLEPTPAKHATPGTLPGKLQAKPPAKPWSKRLLFRLHWLAGLTLGLELAFAGITGALMAYEDPLMRLASPGIVTVAARPDTPALSPDALLARVHAQRPGKMVTGLTLNADPGLAARVQIGPREAQERAYVDPYDGTLLGPARGEAFFATVRQLHRWLLLPGGPNGVGRQITGAATLALLLLSLSGLYLRWPHRALALRPWLRLDWRSKGRVLYRSLHTVIGTWVLPIYLVFALTGLWWSYGWYRDAASIVLTGAPSPQRDGPGPANREGSGNREGPLSREGRGDAGAPISLDAAWAGFLADTGGHYATALLTLPQKPGAPLRLRYLSDDAPNANAFNEMTLSSTGQVVQASLYAQKPLGARLITAVQAVHRGGYFGWGGTLLFFVAALTMPLLFVTGILLYLARRRAARKRQLAAQKAA